MAPNPEITQRQLISAAEKLFAERGIDGVSLREITVEAGVRNSTALQYHFGTREGLVRAVLRKHYGDIEVHRGALLDEYEREGAHDLRALVAAYIRPLAAKLTDLDGGREYLRITAQLVNRPGFQAREPDDDGRRDTTYRWRMLLAPHLPDVAVRRLHPRFTAIRVTFIELARRAEQPPARSERLFTSHLIDLVTGLLAAPLSAETLEIIDESSRRRAAAPTA